MLDFRVSTFLTVCDTMNYTKAAELLHITQPAVSQHIHYLENYYQTTLFLTDKKKLVLTPQGELLRQSLSTLRHDTELLKTQCLELEHKPMHLSLGSTLTIGEFVLQNPLISYIKSHPDVLLNYTIADTHILLKKLTAGEIDLALIEGYYQKQDYDSFLYRNEPFLPVCACDYPLKRKHYAVTDLLEETLFVREEGSGTRNLLEHYLKSYNLSIADFKKVIVINNLNVIRAAVAAGCGITFLFQSVVSRDLSCQTIRQIQVEGFPISHDFTFLWQKNSIHGDWYQTLCQELIPPPQK
ncbi:MAG: LysR family transcriptional regulator [Lachnospiraceae bacterium]|nr:LysR family transcriptional regulator [Lachnospiraceae bacterium]